MPLPPGTRIGLYEIVAPLGAGGMGEVYRARDTRLGRDVALKVLPDAFVLDHERVARFTREAQVLASLNHPNIAAIYGIEDSAGVHALVLELVEGTTLADRLATGPLPLDEARHVASQIVDALVAAHEQGIVHRDLKPANIAVRRDGTVKVLDFGLAKALDSSQVATDAMQLPTITTPAMTGAGVILGTAAYMSPEQARGRPADHRADIWAFGAVLYEMLSGQRAFPGDTVSDTLAALLKTEPRWDALPGSTPPALSRALRSCLEKDHRRRLQSIGDWRLLIEEAPEQVARRGSGQSRIASGVAVLCAIGFAALAWVHFRERPAAANEARLTRVSITLPAGSELDHRGNPALALSRDGTRLAYVASEGRATRQLYVRTLDATDATRVAGTDGALSPFFSPDGQWIGFFAQGKLKKIPAAGGVAQVLCDAPAGQGGDWAADDTIYFVPFNTAGIWKVGASGGQPEEVTRLDRTKNEVGHRWPQALPGGRAILFTVWTGPGWDEKSVQLQLLSTGERRMLAQGASTGRYVDTGHLVYNRDGEQRLKAQPFDLAESRVTGPAVALDEKVWEGGAEGAQFAVSDAGILAYVASQPARYQRRLAWVDRAGAVEVLTAPLRPYYDPKISPDGRRVAVSSEEGTERVWLFDFARSTMTALTTADASSQSPAWTPDGARVLFRGTRAGFRNLFWKAADGSGSEERLTTSENLQTPVSVSPDGKLASFMDVDQASGLDIWLVSLDGDHMARPFLATSARESSPHFSPDGRWLAYSSDETGRSEIYVRPFPGPGGSSTISTDGGTEPVWSRDGRELFYRSGNRIVGVPISTTNGLAAGAPRPLFEGPFEPTGTGTSGFDVSLDGRRFLVIQPTQPEPAATEVSVVINWFQELTRLVPAPR